MTKLSRTFCQTYIEASFTEKLNVWLDDVQAPCTNCGCDTRVPQVDLIWTQPDGSEKVMGVLCYVCHDEYFTLLRTDKSAEYWSSVQYLENMLRRRGGSNG